MGRLNCVCQHSRAAVEGLAVERGVADEERGDVDTCGNRRGESGDVLQRNIGEGLRFGRLVVCLQRERHSRTVIVEINGESTAGAGRELRFAAAVYLGRERTSLGPIELEAAREVIGKGVVASGQQRGAPFVERSAVGRSGECHVEGRASGNRRFGREFQVLHTRSRKGRFQKAVQREARGRQGDGRQRCAAAKRLGRNAHQLLSCAIGLREVEVRTCAFLHHVCDVDALAHFFVVERPAVVGKVFRGGEYGRDLCVVVGIEFHHVFLHPRSREAASKLVFPIIYAVARLRIATQNHLFAHGIGVRVGLSVGIHRAVVDVARLHAHGDSLLGRFLHVDENLVAHTVHLSLGIEGTRRGIVARLPSTIKAQTDVRQSFGHVEGQGDGDGAALRVVALAVVCTLDRQQFVLHIELAIAVEVDVGREIGVAQTTAVGPVEGEGTARRSTDDLRGHVVELLGTSLCRINLFGIAAVLFESYRLDVLVVVLDVVVVRHVRSGYAPEVDDEVSGERSRLCAVVGVLRILADHVARSVRPVDEVVACRGGSHDGDEVCIGDARAAALNGGGTLGSVLRLYGDGTRVRNLVLQDDVEGQGRAVAEVDLRLYLARGTVGGNRGGEAGERFAIADDTVGIEVKQEGGRCARGNRQAEVEAAAAVDGGAIRLAHIVVNRTIGVEGLSVVQRHGEEIFRKELARYIGRAASGLVGICF